ncbi:MAG: selenocysteine synthase [Acidobacteria bacterium]|nr:selenocysteine synthase [Acidobacteriota bacterium]
MSKFSRRSLMQGGAALPALAATKGSNGSTIYSKVGMKPVINGMGTVTVLGGSIMAPEVVRAMEEASRHFVRMPELKENVGKRLAELLNVPAAMVTTGAAGAISVATAACMASGDLGKVGRLPDTQGAKTVVIQQKTHRSGYEAQIELCGARVVAVETREELDRAINADTAMLFFLNKDESKGKIKREEWIRVGKERGVPTFNDAAADVPPSSRLTDVVKQGFDLVCFSGGKGLRGPQSTGLLLGREDLIAAGQRALSPNGGVGRGMKVGKEEMMGLLAAVERFLRVDHAAEARMLDKRVAEMSSALDGLAGLKCSREIPSIANEVPHLVVQWDEAAAKVTARDLMKKLEEGEPSISILGQGPGKVMVSVWMMQGNEHRIVARRMREIFSGA